MTSGLAVLLANITGGLPGSGADGSVAYKARAGRPRHRAVCGCSLRSAASCPVLARWEAAAPQGQQDHMQRQSC